MSKKKIILLSIIAALSLVLVLQIVLGRDEAFRTVGLGEDVSIDEIVIVNADGESLKLILENGLWLVSERKFPGDQEKIANIVDKISSVKVIDAVSSRKLYERYEVDEGSRITVTALQNGTSVRTLYLGKASATSKQSYLLMDDDSRVLLVSGNYRRDFSKQQDDFRDKNILSIKPESISRLVLSGTVKDSQGDFTIPVDMFSMVKDAGSGTWIMENSPLAGGVPVDQEKITNYLRGFSALKASDFKTSGTVPQGDPLFSIEIDAVEGTSFLSVLEKLDDGYYLCRTSESEYSFRLSSYSTEKFMKGPEEFVSR